jgi:hypothetical protein
MNTVQKKTIVRATAVLMLLVVMLSVLTLPGKTAGLTQDELVVTAAQASDQVSCVVAPRCP